MQGVGDLRFYGIVQLLPVLLIAATLVLFPEGDIRARDFWSAFALYSAAKTTEFMDAPLYRWTGLVSGHTLKHFFAGAAVFCLLGISHSTWERVNV